MCIYSICTTYTAYSTKTVIGAISIIAVCCVFVRSSYITLSYIFDGKLI